MYKQSETDNSDYTKVINQDYINDYDNWAYQNYYSYEWYLDSSISGERQLGQQSNGSDSYYYDDFNTYEITEAGTYVIELDSKYQWYYDRAEGFKWGTPDGVDYELQVSVENHKRDAWAFKPESIIEGDRESLNNTGIGVNIDDWTRDQNAPDDLTIAINTDSENWYNFANANIGDEVPEGNLNIDSSTPYTTITGAGDGTFDRYNFVITADMVNSGSTAYVGDGNGVGAGKFVGSSESADTWYSSATVDMAGAAIAGQTLSTTLVINKPGEAAHTTVLVNNVAVDPVNGLAFNLGAALTAAGLSANDIVLSYNGSEVTLTAATNVGFYIDSDVIVTQPENAVSARTNIIDNHDATGNIQFSYATLSLSNLNDGDTWFIKVGDKQISQLIDTTNPNFVLASALGSAITGLSSATPNELTYSGTAAAISVWVEHTRSSQNGSNPPSALLSGTPASVGEGQIMEIDFGAAEVNYYEERWSLTVTDNNSANVFLETISSGDTYSSRSDILTQFKSLLDTAGHITTINGTVLEITVPTGEGVNYSLDIDYSNITTPTVSNSSALLIAAPTAATDGTQWLFSDGVNDFTFTVGDIQATVNNFAESFVAEYTNDSDFTNNLVIDGSYILVDTTTAPSSFSLRQVLATTVTDAVVVGGKAIITMPDSPVDGDFLEVSLDTDLISTDANVTFTYDDATSPVWTSSDSNYALDLSGNLTSSIVGVNYITVSSAKFFDVISQAYVNSTEYIDTTISHQTATPLKNNDTITATIGSTVVTFTYATAGGGTWSSSSADYNLTDDGSVYTVKHDINNTVQSISSVTFASGADTEILTPTNANSLLVSDLTSLAPATNDRVVATFTPDANPAVTVTFEYDGANWSSTNGELYSLSNAGRLLSTSSSMAITTTAASYQGYNNQSYDNIDLYGSAFVGYPAGFTTAQMEDQIALTVNGSTIKEVFIFDGSNWSNSNNYTLMDDSTQFVVTDSDDTNPLVITNASYIFGASESLKIAKKLTFTDFDQGDYKLTQDDDGGDADSTSGLLDLIAVHYSGNGNYEVQKAADATAAYIYTTDNSDLTTLPAMSFAATINEGTSQAQISYSATQTNDDTYVVEIDISTIKGNFAHDDSWTFSIVGASSTITLNATTDLYSQLDADLESSFAGYNFEFDQSNNTLSISNTSKTFFDADSVLLSEEIVSDPPILSAQNFFDTYAHNFSDDALTVSSGKAWKVIIDGVEQASATATSNDNGDLPSIDTVLQSLEQQLSDKGFSADLTGTDSRTLTITDLNDVIVEVALNTEGGVGALFDLDNVEVITDMLYTFNYDYTNFAYPDTNTVSETKNFVSGAVYSEKTPFIIVYELTNALDTAKVAELAMALAPEQRAGFLNRIDLVKNENIDGQVLSPIAVKASSDPFIENTFKNTQDTTYVVEIGHIESTLYEYDILAVTTTSISKTITLFPGFSYETTTRTSSSETINYKYGPYGNVWNGVASNASYELNVSIQEHDINPDNQTLENKKIRVISGPGAGAEGDIVSFTAYNSAGQKVNSFVITETGGDWSDVGAESRYEIYDAVTLAIIPANDEVDFGKWELGLSDTYQVALTKVTNDIITVTDLPTATSNYRNLSLNMPDDVQTKSEITDNVVEVSAKEDERIDGGDLQVFAPAESRVNIIRGPISIEGGVIAASYVDLNNPVLLPNETNNPVPNGTKAPKTTVGNQDGALIDGGVQIELADIDKTTITRAELEAFLAQPEVQNGEYLILEEYLDANPDVTEFATFVDEDATYFDEAANNGDGNEALGFEPRANIAPYEIGFIDKVNRKELARFDIIATVGTRIILAGEWPVGDFEINNEYFYRPLNRNERVIETDQVDSLNFNNSGSPVDEYGVLTSDSIIGFGMGADIELAGITIPGGIRYSGLETLNLLLGSGSDNVTIESTHAGVTNINTGEGGSEINIKTISGHTFIHLISDQGAANDNIVTVSSDNHIVDQIMGLLTVVGDEVGNNILIIDDSGDTNNNTLQITDTTITGLDMPSVPESFVLEIQAETGQYQLSLDSTVSETLDWNTTTDELKDAISILTGEPVANILVTLRSGNEDDQIKEYLITFVGESAGKNITNIKSSIPNTNGLAFTQQFTLKSSLSDGNYELSSASGAAQILDWDADETAIIAAVKALAEQQDLVVSVDIEAIGMERVYTIDIAPLYDDNGTYFVVPQLSVAHVGQLTSTSTASTNYSLQLDNVSASYTLLIRDDAGAVKAQELVSSFATEAEFKAIVASLLGIDTTTSDLTVGLNNQTYTVTYIPTDGALDLSRLDAAQQDLTLSNTTAFAPRAQIEYLTEGTKSPDLNTIQTITVGSGDITLTLFTADGIEELGSVTFNSSDSVLPKATPSDADVSLFDKLSVLLNPNNTEARRNFYPETDNFSLIKAGNDFIITFQGEYAGYAIKASDITGEATVVKRANGINYYGIDQLVVNTGSGDDVINVRSTNSNTITTIRTGAGDDQFHISSSADGSFVDQYIATGTLDGIKGELNLEGGDDNNALFISDFDSMVADTDIQMSVGSISGIATATINYGTSITGTFNNGLVVWTGQSDDRITISSIDLTGTTITQLYTGAGNDDIQIKVTDDIINPLHSKYLPNTVDRALQVLSGDGADVIDASQSQLAVNIHSGNDEDIVRGGEGGDVIYGGDARDILFGGDGNDYLFGEVYDADPLINISSDIIFGDHGKVDVVDSNNVIYTIASSVFNFDDRKLAITDVIDSVASVASLKAGDDEIVAGEGNNIVLGGLGSDTITTGSSEDIVLGDTGIVQYVQGQLDAVTATGATGGNDTITTGEGNDLVMAGGNDSGLDIINTGIGTDTIFGDTGVADYTNNVFRTDSAASGTDDITDLDGDSRVLAGGGIDIITLADGNHDILADTGSFDYEVGLFTADENGSGDDVVTTGAGNQRILGGNGADTITTTSGNNYILGDTGTFQFSGDVLTKAVAEGINGAVDIINSGDGDNIILAGGGSDSISSGNGFDIILGDNGFWDGTNQRLESISDDDLGNDIISAGSGGSLISAGLGDDEITTNGIIGIAETDIVFGDDGFIQYDGESFELETLHTVLDGNDEIHIDGDYDIVLGGYGDDVISMDDGALPKNIVIGDAAQISHADGEYTIIQQSTLIGGNDSVQGSGLLLGGSGINEYKLGGSGTNEDELGEGGYSDTLLDIILSLTVDEKTLTFPSGPDDYIELPSLISNRSEFISLNDTTSIASKTEGLNDPLNDIAILRKPLLDTDVRDIKSMSNEQLRDFLRSLPLPADRVNLATVKSVGSVIDRVSQIEEKQRDKLVNTYQRISSLIDDVESELYAFDGSVSRLQAEIINMQQELALAQKAYENEPSAENKLNSIEKIESYNKLDNQLDEMKEKLKVLLEQYKLELESFTDDIEVSESLLLVAMSRPAWQLSSLNAVDNKAAVKSTKRRFRFWER